MKIAIKAILNPPNKNRQAAILAESGRYFLVSVAALALDYGLLVGLTRYGHLNYIISAACGFTAGLMLSYVLSAAFVFREHRLTSRQMEFVIFALIGIVGLALNEGLMKLFVDFGGLHYAIAKIPAAGIGFIFNFGTRRLLLFTTWKRRTSSIDARPIPFSNSARPQPLS